LQDQLHRASSSIALNLAEGSGKRTPEDQRHFYSMSFGNLKECQAILELEEIDDRELKNLINRLGAMLFKLSRKQLTNKRDGNVGVERQTSAVDRSSDRSF
jgi:four helix bundle protein